MGLWSRIRTLFGAKINRALDRMENPAETLDYSYEKQLSLLRDVKRGLVPGILPQWKQAIMPVLCLAALPTAYLARLTRASMLEVLRQDYVRTARAKGLRNITVLYRHSLRNARGDRWQCNPRGVLLALCRWHRRTPLR